MAVNTQKLLPAAKTTSVLAKANVGKIFSSASIKTKKIDTKKLVGPLAKRDEPGAIVNTLTDIDTRLKLLLGEEKSQQSRKKKEKEQAKFQKAEEKLEAPKESKKFRLPGLAVPGMSFLDRIKRFLFFTALGWLFTKFQDQLPKLVGIVKTITQVYGVAENIFKTLLTGLVNFIDIGYQTYDGLRKQVENIGGKDAVKTFDEFSGHLNKLLNGAIIAATLIASTTPKKPNAPSGAGASAGVQKPTTPKPTSGFGAGTAMTPGRYRAPGQSAARGFGVEQARKGLTFEQSVAAQRASKPTPVTKGARFGGGRIPIIGPLITFGIRTMVYGEKPEKAAAAAVGMGIGQAIGGFIGTLGATALGLGTAGLGAFVAPLIIGAGSIIGGLVGEWLGAKLYDFVAGLGKNKPQLKAAGGPVTRGGKTQGAPTRTIRVTRRKPPKVKPQSSQPGKDVGGKKKVKELYPDPSAKTDIEGPQKGPWWSLLPPLPKNATPQQIQDRDNKIKKLPNPYKALTNTAKILKDIPFGIGALMGGAVDIALGQKLPKNAIDGLSNGISYLINALANQQVAKSISGIQKEIATMQTGGITPRLRDFSRNERDEFGSGINKVLSNLIQQKVDEAIREVQKQLMPGKYGGGVFDEPGGGRGQGGGGGGPSPTGEGLNQPTVKGKSGYQGSTNVIDIGYKDAQGRSIKLNPNAAQAFKSMVSDGMPFKSSDVANTYRDESEYLRLIKEGYNPASNSAHNYGEGADIHGTMGEWIKKNGKKYGWYYVDYPGTPGGHFEWRGKVSKSQQPTDTKNVKELSGQISFYGTKQDGFGYEKGKMTTASGEKFIPSGLTAAHKTLQFGTKLRVTNPNNGKSVIVTVNDRGPFSGNRVLDLSYGAAKAIDMIGSGVINGKIEVLKKPGDRGIPDAFAGGGDMQGGGYIPRQSPRRDTQRLSSYPSYSAEGGMVIAIQPMIIEKPVPVPSGKNRTIMFPIPVGVNNNSMPSLSRG